MPRDARIFKQTSRHHCSHLPTLRFSFALSGASASEQSASLARCSAVACPCCDDDDDDAAAALAAVVVVVPAVKERILLRMSSSSSCCAFPGFFPVGGGGGGGGSWEEAMIWLLVDG